MSVTICSSSRFFDVAKSVAMTLKDLGMRVYTPRFDFNETIGCVNEKEKKKLTLEFLAELRKSRYIYVIDMGGYTGCSVSIEIGYAFGLGKTIILSELAEELAVRALTNQVVPVDSIREFFQEELSR